MRNALDRPRPGLVIFDCDGVLVDSELIDARIRSECFQAEGFAVTAEDLRNHPGISGAGLAEMIQERFGRPMPEGFMQATRAKIMRVFTDELRAIDGVAELLGVIEHAGLRRLEQSYRPPSALVGGHWSVAVFRPARVQRHHGRARQPAPDLFLLAAEKLGVAPRDCVVVEDSVHGIAAARAAGMEVIGFCGASHCRPGHAERLISAGCERVFALMGEIREFLHPFTAGNAIDSHPGSTRFC